MKKCLILLLALFSLNSYTLASPNLVLVTGSEVSFTQTDIIQIVGVVANTSASTTTGYNASYGPSLKITFSDGTIVTNSLVMVDTEDPGDAYVSNNKLLGNTLIGVTSLQVIPGVAGAGTGAVTVKIVPQASELVSEPVVLPLIEDQIFTISVETSVDMTNWAPAAPGDFLATSSHRFFRLKAVQKQ